MSCEVKFMYKKMASGSTPAPRGEELASARSGSNFDWLILKNVNKSKKWAEDLYQAVFFVSPFPRGKVYHRNEN